MVMSTDQIRCKFADNFSHLLFYHDVIPLEQGYHASLGDILYKIKLETRITETKTFY